MSRYFKYTWVILLAQLFFAGASYLLSDVWVGGEASIVIRLMVELALVILFYIYLYRIQEWVASQMQVEDSKANVIFAQVLPVIIFFILSWIFLLVNPQLKFLLLEKSPAYFTPIGFAFLILSLALNVAVANMGLNNALKMIDRYAEHAQDKWLGREKPSRDIISGLIIGLAIAAIVFAVFKPSEPKESRPHEDPLRFLDNAIIGTSTRYPDFYGGSYYGCVSEEKNVEDLYIPKPIHNDGEEDLGLEDDEEFSEDYGYENYDECLVVMLKKPQDEFFNKKLIAIGRDNKIRIVTKPCKFSKQELIDLSDRMHSTIAEYVKDHPNSAIAKEEEALFYPGIVEYDEEANAILISSTSRAAEKEARKLFGNREEFIYLGEE